MYWIMRAIIYATFPSEVVRVYYWCGTRPQSCQREDCDDISEMLLSWCHLISLDLLCWCQLRLGKIMIATGRVLYLSATTQWYFCPCSPKHKYTWNCLQNQLSFQLGSAEPSGQQCVCNPEKITIFSKCTNQVRNIFFERPYFFFQS